MANRTKMTAANVARFLTHIRAGLWRDDAARLCGIGARTIDLWVAKGKRSFAKMDAASPSEDPKLDRWGNFLIALEAAEAEVAAQMIGVVQRIAVAGDSDDVKLRAATWYLSRKDNLRYGSGSQRTDLRGATPQGYDDDTDVDAGAFVLDALRKFVEVKAAAVERAGDGSTGE